MKTTWSAIALSMLLLGCPENGGRRPGGGEALAQSGDDDEAPMPAGTTCRGNGDCSEEQACVEARCRHLRTSAAGEILATAARAQVEAGDLDGAAQTYDQAIDRFAAAEVPIPPEVLCGAAIAALRAATDVRSRDVAARRADTCFRASVPGDPLRAEVQRGLARLRYEGLELGLFDRERPAERFFTQEPSRPTVDAIEIALDLPESESPGFAEVRDAMRSEAATRAIADCFVADWERRHERSANASLVMSLTSRMRDMGLYDVYEATIEITGTSGASEGFEPCVAQALKTAIGAGPRTNRVVSWRETFAVAARLH